MIKSCSLKNARCKELQKKNNFYRESYNFLEIACYAFWIPNLGLLKLVLEVLYFLNEQKKKRKNKERTVTNKNQLFFICHSLTIVSQFECTT